MWARRVVFGLLAALVLFTGAASAQNINISNIVGNVSVGQVAAGSIVRSIATGLGSSVATFAINGVLEWLLGQATNAVGNAEFDEWLNWQSQIGGCVAPFDGNYGITTIACARPAAANPPWWCPPGQSCFRASAYGTEAFCVRADGNNFQLAGGTEFAGYYQQYAAVCGGSSGPRPSFADWVSGNYTPQAGKSAVPHPFAPGGLNAAFQRYYDNNKAAVIAGTDPFLTFNPHPDPYDFDPTLPVSQRCRLPRIWLSASSSCGVPPTCVSPAEWTGSACVVPSCPSGQVRSAITGVCAPSNTVCYSGEVWNGSACVPLTCPSGQLLQGGSCVPVPSCPAGEHRENGVCVPDATACPEGLALVGGQCVPPPPADDCGIGGSNSILNLDKLGKCWFKPTKTFAERWATTQASYAGKFPLSLGAWIPSPASVGTFDCQLVNINLTGSFGLVSTGQLILNPCNTPFGVWMNTIGRNILLAAAIAGLMWSIVARGSAP